MNILFFLTPKSEVAHLQKEWTLRQAIEKLERSGLTVTVRREMGRDIDGACGQLRRKYKENQRLA